MCPGEECNDGGSSPLPPYRFKRQRAVKRRCWPDPSDTVGRRDAFRSVIPINGGANSELPLARVPPLELEFGYGRRVEDSGAQTPNPCWQEPPRKVPRSSSRTLGVQEALSALLYQPYECRNDSSDSDDEWPLDGGSVCASLHQQQQQAAAGWLQRQEASSLGRPPSVSSAPVLGADAAVSISGAASRMVSVSVEAEGGPAAATGLPADEVETEDEERRLCSMPHVSSVQIVPCERTFTSTEAQTDPDSREQRRRERRERRQQRLLRNNAPPPPPPQPPHQVVGGAALAPGAAATTCTTIGATAEELPDRLLPDLLLNSYHQPPPYSTLPIRAIAGPPPPPQAILVPTTALAAAPGSPPAPLVHQPLAMRFSFPISPSSRRCRGGSGRASHLSEEPKSCCGLALTQAASIRWFIVLIAFVGVCCAVVGTVLGAMRASGREHLTISLLMIGVGIVLVLVSGVGWRLTAHDAPSCRAMLGLGGHSSRGGGIGDGDGAEPNRRFVPRLPPSYGRPHHPYAAMIYPEFQYRPPPPSYQASMQEYRLRLLLLDRGATQPQPPPPAAAPMAAVSPPPTYRSNVGSMLRAPMLFRRDNNQSVLTGDASVCSSRPPSYRSRAGSTRPASVAAGVDINPSMGLTPTPSPTPPSPQPPSVSVICVGSPKYCGSGAMPIEVDSEKTSLHEEQGHLVTIVQTGHSITSDPGVTTVTVSGLLASTSAGGGRQLVFTPASADGEMEILAHL